MCGITGLYCYESKDISDKEFDNFVDSLIHRGPDGRGTFKDNDVFLRLGHRRLSILDLSKKGTQPLSYANKRYWITFNGEIYNFLELKKELQKLGYKFETNTDTEIILASYLHWKEDCQFKFNGMWAFAIWDIKEKELFLSRDRFGVKPMHYYLDNKAFAFASEIKAFWHLNNLNVSFNNQMVANTLADTNFWEPTEFTMYTKVKRLPAGYCAWFSKKKKLIIKKWWDTLKHTTQVETSKKQKAQKLKDLFYDACKIRMRSDVPIGSALSGGLDSSSVLCVISEIGNNLHKNERISCDWKKVFTALYPNTIQDEYKYAKEVIDHTKSEAIFYDIQAENVINELDDLLYYFEEIFDIPIGQWLLYKQFRKNNRVISIDGHGADELFGGYHHHVQTLGEDSLNNSKIFQYFKYIKLLKGLYVSRDIFKSQNGHTYLKILRQFIKNKINNFSLFQKILQKLESTIFKIKDNIFSARCHPSHFKLLNIEPQLPDLSLKYINDKNYLNLDTLNRLLYKDFHYSTMPVILRNFDRCSMAHGVEIRAPFLDYRIVTYAFSLKQNDKINNGFTKYLIRQSMKNILPEKIRTRKSKIGFANPSNQWFQTGLKSFILDSINSQSFKQSPIWNGKEIKKHIETCFKNKAYNYIGSSWACIIAHNLINTFNKRHKRLP